MTWFAQNWPMVGDLFINHLWLSIPAIVMSTCIAVPLGWFCAHRPGLGRVISTRSSLLYTIPALPLLIIIPTIFATPLRSPATVIIALTVYGTALMVRSATDAFAVIDEHLRDVAIALGYGPFLRFFMVELAVAAPVLFAGLRVVAVSTIALVTIGALVGIPSLGSLLTDGFQRGIVEEVAVGIGLTMLFALVVDLLLSATQRILMPWVAIGHQREATP